MRRLGFLSLLIGALALQAPGQGLAPDTRAKLSGILAHRVDAPPLTTDVLRERHRAVLAEVHRLRAGGVRPLTDVDGWAAVFADARRFPPAAERGVVITRPFAGYSVRVPKEYDPARPTPLVVCLHGQQERTGRAYLRRIWADARIRDRAILFAVDWPEEGDPEWSRRGRRDQLFRMIYSEVFARYNVDRDRIFLDAKGPSAHHAWVIASQFADVFAGVIARSERWTPRTPPKKARRVQSGNLRHLGWLQFVRKESLGTKDQPTEYGEFWRQELTSFGIDPNEALIRVDPDRWVRLLSNPLEALIAPIDALLTSNEIVIRTARFIETKRRNLFPTTIEWTITDPDARRGYWIRSLAERPGLDDDTLPQLRVFVDRANNKLDIRSRHVTGVEISLNDRILDLGRPITIEVDKRVRFHGLPARSLGRVLQEIERTGDSHRVFPWVVRVEMPPKNQ